MKLGIGLLLTGTGILCAVLGLFYLKDRLRNWKLARFAMSGLVMRFTVIAVVLILVGAMIVVSKLFS